MIPISKAENGYPRFEIEAPEELGNGLFQNEAW